MCMYDIIIIGAGVVGAMIARKLSRYNLSVCVLEKENDVGNVTSNANSAIVHSGYDPVPGTLKAKLNVLGNSMFDEIAENLDVHFYRKGSLTVAVSDEQMQMLHDLEKRSQENGVPVQILNKEEVLAMEPNINPEVKGALFAPTAGIVDPFNLVVHTMENAVDNGVKLFVNQEVKDIKYLNDEFVVKTQDKEYHAKVVINAAGLYSDKIASMIEPIDWSITVRKGEYFVLDHYKVGLVNHTIFPLPTAKGKGVLVSMTSSNNYIVGPSSEPIPDKDDVSTDAYTLGEIRRQATELVPSIPFSQVIRVFAGDRPTPSTHDFVINTAKCNDHFINCGGIESPGLASSPAIAEYVFDNFVSKLFNLEEKKDYNPKIKKYHRLNEMSEEQRNQLIKENPDYGKIICSCEKVSLGEIKELLDRSVPPTTVKGVKRRCRAGFGKCQGGFCSPMVTLILADHYKVSPLDIKWDKENSPILVEEVKKL